MPDLSNLYTECPECGEETLHRILKGKFSTGKKVIIDAVVECSECSHVHHVIMDEGREVDIPIIVSRQGTSRRGSISFPGKEVITVGDDFMYQDSLVMVTSIESGGKRVKTVPAERIDTIWAKWYEKMPLGVSINKGNRTLSKKIWAVPDEEFYVGEVVEIDGMRIAFHRFKTANRVVYSGTAKASEIVRIYGKMAAREEHGHGAAHGRRSGYDGRKGGYGRRGKRRKGGAGGREARRKGGAGDSGVGGKRADRRKYRETGGTGRGVKRRDGKGGTGGTGGGASGKKPYRKIPGEIDRTVVQRNG